MSGSSFRGQRRVAGGGGALWMSGGNLPHFRCKFLAELKEPEKQVSHGSVWRAAAAAAAAAEGQHRTH